MYRKNVWNKYKNKKAIFEFAEGYKDFLSRCKTERLVTKEAIKMLEEHGFVNADTIQDREVKPGDRVYFVNKNKNIIAFIVGTKPFREGLRILGAHIDSPRLDLKENPLYEDHGLVLADTHYYGGIKKYLWVTTPLALHGVIVKRNGEVVEVNIGEKDDDPVVGVTDLLIHLSAEQMAKPANKVVEGEALDITIGNMPLGEGEKETVKANVLRILKEKYNIEEEDFISSEIEVVPAGKARDYGLDRSMIAGYGHDDRSCAYASLLALIETENVEYTACLSLVDKEEIGSVGATGASSLVFENAVCELAYKMNEKHPFLHTRKALEASYMLSNDVSAGYDPLYPSVNDLKNASFLGEGLTFNKYTGGRGKSGSNDSNAEYYGWVRRVMEDAGICWQNAELGKVDQGGGGTIAYILGNYNMHVIDAGIPVHSMHAPMEIISKADLYEAYVGYKAFLVAKK